MPDPADLIYRYARSVAEQAQMFAILYDRPTGGVGRPRGVRARCGTIEAYQQHLYYGETTDPACREANNVKGRTHKAGLRDNPPVRTKPAPRCGTTAAHAQHRYYGEPIDPKCAAAHSANVSKNDKIRRQQGRFKEKKRKKTGDGR